MSAQPPGATGLARRLLAARTLRLAGALLWLAAGIHFAAYPLLRHSVAESLPPDAFAFVWPPFAFSFLLDGILLLPLGFTALYCAGGVMHGERWATTLGLVCAAVVLVLPIALGLVMGFGYFGATPLLVAALAILAAGTSSLAALVLLWREGRPARPVPRAQGGDP